MIYTWYCIHKGETRSTLQCQKKRYNYWLWINYNLFGFKKKKNYQKKTIAFNYLRAAEILKKKNNFFLQNWVTTFFHDGGFHLSILYYSVFISLCSQHGSEHKVSCPFSKMGLFSFLIRAPQLSHQRQTYSTLSIPFQSSFQSFWFASGKLEPVSQSLLCCFSSQRFPFFSINISLWLFMVHPVVCFSPSPLLRKFTFSPMRFAYFI